MRDGEVENRAIGFVKTRHLLAEDRAFAGEGQSGVLGFSKIDNEDQVRLRRKFRIEQPDAANLNRLWQVVWRPQCQSRAILFHQDAIIRNERSALRHEV